MVGYNVSVLFYYYINGWVNEREGESEIFVREFDDVRMFSLRVVDVIKDCEYFIYCGVVKE